MTVINYKYYKSPYGELMLASFNNKLCMCDWRYRKMRATIDNRIEKRINAKLVAGSDAIIDLAITQLEEYFERKRKDFDVPLLLVGTDFQRKVWHGLIKTPFGQTLSYMELSETIANRNSVRAVANANGANAISIFIPCHRIIGSNGALVGYAGGLQAKLQLIEMEKDLFN
jgi:methylated-DNA-[protein]-cysteine S-methyltransferase